MRRAALFLLTLTGSLVAAAAAAASIFIGFDAQRITFGVDARGAAVVKFRSHGKVDIVVVPAHGQLFHGGSLSGPDVSRPARVPGLPLASIVRRTPDGTLWALQAWQVEPGGQRELHLARWKGDPTKLTLELDGRRLTGRGMFHGRPVTGRTFTLEGKKPRIYVWLDCFACGGKPGWTRMIGIPPKTDGSFRAFLRPAWRGKKYRATIAGPNIGRTFAPDARTIISAG